MGVATVARDDFLNAVRSSLVVGVVGAFVALGAFVFLTESDIHPHPYRSLYDLMQAFILVGPLLLAPLTYAAVVGDRASGRIKFVMGLPNSRGEYFAGKALSRLGLAAVATVGSVATAFVVAAATFANAPDPGRFALFAGTTTLFMVTFAAVFVAVSAFAGSRSGAMLGAVGVYFVLVLFWLGVAPYMNLDTLLAAVGNLLGSPLSEPARNLVRNLSPWFAYGGTTGPVFTGVPIHYPPLPSGEPDRHLHERLWFDLLVLAGWLAGSLAVGYAGFRRSELGG